MDDLQIDSDSILASCNCLTKTPDPKYHKKGCKYRLISERDALQAESKRLREALEYSICKHCHDPYPYHQGACEVTSLLFREALSPSAPVQPGDFGNSTYPVTPLNTKELNWKSEAIKAWDKLPHRASQSEPTLNFLQGFQLGWNHPALRFHPATTTSYESATPNTTPTSTPPN